MSEPIPPQKKSDEAGAEPLTPRREGRIRACEGILRSRFGQRGTQAGHRALEQLRLQTSAPARIDNSRRKWLLPLAACVIAGVMGFLLYRSAQPKVESIAQLRASAKAVLIRNGKETAADTGAGLMAGDRIRVQDGGAATVVYPDKTEIELVAGTEAAFSAARSSAEGKVIVLDRGTLHASIAKQAESRPMWFVTPHAEAVVRGTRLKLALVDQQTRLEVTEGLVELVRKEERVAVNAGQYAVAREGVALASASSIIADPALTEDKTTLPKLKFDFEDGKRPALWVVGVIQAEPPREGNRFCLAGETTKDNPWSKVKISAGLRRTLFVHDMDLELSFDYWVDEKVGSLDFYVWNNTQQDSFGNFFITNLAQKKWTRATVRLARLSKEDGSKKMRVGDLINELSIQVGQEGGVLYVDNVEISRQHIEAPQEF
jgi:hypothetical protein